MIVRFTFLSYLISPTNDKHPIKNGNCIISIDTVVSKINASGATVYLFQEFNNSLKQIGKPLEVIITDQVNGYLPLFPHLLCGDKHEPVSIPQANHSSNCLC